ncbi:FAD-binding oxidoreductase [Micromonospora craterilacus]|uniref:FAD-binding oxidoreductase n=1 Tax=Micromonospora craterilacus TaxID=1655439 RepID=UPI0018F5B17F|nr:FAD-binding oxidoreductase [Micromonospora craterilacus]
MHTFVDTVALVERVRGPVLRPGDDGFTTEIAGFNSAIVHRPQVVVAATDAGDVAAAVGWAAEQGLSVAVQSTGHGQLSAVDDGMLISTRRLDEVRIDPVARRARVGAGVRWRRVIDAAAEHGLAPLSGSSSQVGVVGYTLGGGLPVLARSYGFAADHVRAVELVTADGLVRRIDAEHEPDLFWALRGAGRIGFGVVTAIEFDLVPVRRLYGGGIFYPASATAEVLHTFRTWVPTLSELTTASVALLRLPDLPQLPEPLRGRFVVHLRTAHLGSAEDGERVLAPMRAAAPALIDTVAEMSYVDVDAIHSDPTDPMPAHHAGIVLRHLPAEAVDALIAVAGPQVDVPLAMVELRLLGGALARPAAVPNAAGGRAGAFSLLGIGPLLPGLEQVVPAVVRSVLDALEPFAATDTALANFQGSVEATVGPYGSWSGADAGRLSQLKDRYDPTGMFGPGKLPTRPQSGVPVRFG